MELDCYNYITVSSGETIIMTFLEFDTDEPDLVTVRTCIQVSHANILVSETKQDGT